MPPLAEAFVRVGLDKSQFERELRGLGRTSVGETAGIRAGGQFGEAFKRGFRQALSTMKFPSVRVQAMAAGNIAGRQYASGFKGGFKDAADNIDIPTNVTEAFTSGKITGAAYSRGMEKGVRERAKALKGPLASDGKSLGSTIAGNMVNGFNEATKAWKFAAITSAATAAISSLTAALPALGGAAMLAVGAVGLIPGAVFGAAASLGALKLATAGVGNAMKAVASGDTKKFEESLKKLSPAAREFAQSLRQVWPQLKALQQSVQQAFFKPLVNDVTLLSRNLLPTLKTGLLGVSAALGQGAHAFSLWAASRETVLQLGFAFQGVKGVVSTLNGLITPLGHSILTLVVQALPFLNRGAAVLVGWARSLDLWLTGLRNTGQLKAFFDKVASSFAQLGRIARNVGLIIFGIFRAAPPSGNVLDRIEAFTDKMQKFVNSFKGQGIIAQLIKIAAVIAPIAWAATIASTAISALSSILAVAFTPVGAIVAVVGLLTVGFIVLYNKSAALRTIVGLVWGKLKELWNLIATQGLPVMRELGGKVLKAAEKAFNDILGAIQRNRPQLEQLFNGLKNVVGFIVTKVVPILGFVLVGAIRLVGIAISTSLDIWGMLVKAWNGIVVAAKAVGAAALWLWNNALGPAFRAIWSFVRGVLGPVFLWLFRNITLPVLKGIGGLFMLTWNNVLRPTFNYISIAVRNLGAIFSWLWRNVTVPVWNAIRTVIVFAWNNVIKPVFNLMVASIKALGAWFSWLWRNVLVPVWNAIKVVISIAWNTVIKPIFTSISGFIRNILAPIFNFLWAVVRVAFSNIKTFIGNMWITIKATFGYIVGGVRSLGSVFSWLWRNVVVPVWNAIRTAISFSWNSVIKPVWNAIVAGLKTVGGWFSWLWSKVISPVWNAVKNTIASVWNSGIKPVFLAIGNFLTKSIPNAFRAGVSAIGRLWHSLQDLAKKPVNFVIGTVINKGIIGTFNKIMGMFPGKQNKLANLPTLQSGGPIPGRPSRKDNTLIHAATGEYVVNTRSTQKHMSLLHAINQDRVSGFMRGGIVGGGGGGTSLVPQLTTFAQKSHVPFRVTSGQRFTKDYHGRGMAIDMASSAPRMVALANWLYGRYNQLLELIHSGGPGFFVKNGKRVGRNYYRSVIGQHYNHVHLAMNALGLAGKSVSGADIGGTPLSGGGGFDIAGMLNKAVSSTFKFIGTDSVFGKILAGLPQKVVSFLVEKGQEILSKIPVIGNFFDVDMPGDPGKVSGAAALGQKMAAQRGWIGGQWAALYRLWTGESHWNPNAVNPSSGAYGIPQILPSAHGRPVRMGDAAGQIAWGLNYIAKRYGDPAKAFAFWSRQNPHWYASGGRIPGAASSRDNRLIGAATGEYVVNARSTKKHLPLIDAINRDSFATGGMVLKNLFEDRDIYQSMVIPQGSAKTPPRRKRSVRPTPQKIRKPLIILPGATRPFIAPLPTKPRPRPLPTTAGPAIAPFLPLRPSAFRSGKAPPVRTVAQTLALKAEERKLFGSSWYDVPAGAGMVQGAIAKIGPRNPGGYWWVRGGSNRPSMEKEIRRWGNPANYIRGNQFLAGDTPWLNSFVKRAGVPYVIISGWRNWTANETPGYKSDHQSGRAIDISDKSQENMLRIAKFLYQYSSKIQTLIYSDPRGRGNFYVINGKRLPIDSRNAAAHRDHIHFGTTRRHLRMATGGKIPGAPSHKDNTMIHAATGEYVVNTRSTRKHLPLIEAINRDKLDGFATGGLIFPTVNAPWGDQDLYKAFRPPTTPAISRRPPAYYQPLPKPGITPYERPRAAPTPAPAPKPPAPAPKPPAPTIRTGNPLQGPGIYGLGRSTEWSFNTILAIARWWRRDAKLTSGKRNTNDWHGRGLAADIIGGGAAGMRQIAGGFYQMAPRLLELIHSGGSGYFVKNGKKVARSYYRSVIGQHYNHVHIAGRKDAILAPPARVPTPAATTSVGSSYRDNYRTFNGIPIERIAYRVNQLKRGTNKTLLALIEAGLVESNMRNLPWGDRDSLGFLQQRPSTGWGTPSQILNPWFAATSFLNRAIPRQNNYSTAGRLAQAVQISAFPARYDQRRTQAVGMIRTIQPSYAPGNYASGGVVKFDNGGWLPPRSATLAVNGTNQWEPVGMGGINIAEGAVQVNVTVQGDVGPRQINAIKDVVDESFSNFLREIRTGIRR